jgi:hypothetical protein
MELLACLLLALGAATQARTNYPRTHRHPRRHRCAAADKIEPKTIAWRRDFHEHPELGNREFRTSKIIADHLRSLGLEVHEGVGKTGVVGILRGAYPGPVIGLRADMDALPLVERTPVPFASKVKPPITARKSASCMPAATTPISPL